MLGAAARDRCRRRTVAGGRRTPPEIAGRVTVNPAPWYTAGADTARLRPWRAAVVRLTDRVQVEWIDAKPIAEAGDGEFAVSRLGTLAAGQVTFPRSRAARVRVDVRALGEAARVSRQQTGSSRTLQRIVSCRICLELVGREAGHRIIAAGDLNVLHGHGEHGSAYWSRRYETVFARMRALGVALRRASGSERSTGRSRGPTSSPGTASTSRPITRIARRRRLRRASWTSSSPPMVSATP